MGVAGFRILCFFICRARRTRGTKGALLTTRSADIYACRRWRWDWCLVLSARVLAVSTPCAWSYWLCCWVGSCCSWGCTLSSYSSSIAWACAPCPHILWVFWAILKRQWVPERGQDQGKFPCWCWCAFLAWWRCVGSGGWVVGRCGAAAVDFYYLIIHLFLGWRAAGLLLGDYFQYDAPVG